MGTPAFVNTGTIYFKDSKDVQKAIKQVLEWVKNANEGTLSDKEFNGDYNIREIETDGHCWINFKADSGRVRNLEWQMENFRDFVKTLDNAVAFEAPIMVESESGIFWEVEEDEELECEGSCRN
jgi:transposase